MLTDCPAPVFRHVPYVHVVDVDASLEFYRALGFKADSVVRNKQGVPCWASAISEVDGRAAEIFFARADAPVVPEQQAVIFYMHSEDVEQLRSHLLSSGLHDGGAYRGQCGPNGGRRVVFEVSRPPYMTSGELRVADPDGYCILVGQLS